MMDLTTSLIGLGLVALCIVPVLYFHFAQKAKRNQFIAEFMNLASQHQVKITQHEVWSHFCAIGLDTSANKLFYYKKRGDNVQQLLINLSEVEKCSLINLKKMQNEDEVIDRLALAFSYRNPRAAEKTLDFFSKEDYLALNGELQLVEKWKTIVNAQLDTKKKLAMAG